MERDGSEDIESNLLAGTVKGNFASHRFYRGTQDEAEMIASLFNIPKDSEDSNPGTCGGKADCVVANRGLPADPLRMSRI